MRGLAILAAFLAVFLPGAAHADSEGPWTAALRGTGLAIRGDLRGAADELRPVAQHLAPGAGNVALGLVALQAQDAGAAMRAFERASVAGEATPELFYWRGIAALRLGRRADALRDLERAATLASDHPEYLLALAALRPDPELVVRAASIEPNLLSTVYYPEPRRGLARVCARMLRDLPARAQVRATIARLLYDARLPREAEDWLAAGAPDRTPEEQALLGRIALDRGDVPGAIEALVAASRARNDARALYDLGRAQVAAGRRAEAAVTLRQALDVDPSVPAVLVAAGELAREQGDLPRAQDLAGYALSRAPAFAPALRLQGQVLAARGALSDAGAVLRRAATLAPGDPVVWNALSELAQRRGDARKAAALARRAREAQQTADTLLARAERARAPGHALEDVARPIRAGADEATVRERLEAARRSGAPARAIAFATVAWLARSGRAADARRAAAPLAAALIPLARWSRVPATPNLVTLRSTIDGRRVESVATLDDLVPASL